MDAVLVPHVLTTRATDTCAHRLPSSAQMVISPAPPPPPPLEHPTAPTPTTASNAIPRQPTPRLYTSAQPAVAGVGRRRTMSPVTVTGTHPGQSGMGGGGQGPRVAVAPAAASEQVSPEPSGMAASAVPPASAAPPARLWAARDGSARRFLAEWLPPAGF